MCPRCMSEARHRLLLLYMRDELEITTKPVRILHFAAEYCFIRRFRRMPNITHIVADLDPPRGGIKMDITDIPVDSASVDLVICSHVLEHVEDDSKAMRELKRVLRPGGTALIMCPVYELESTYEDPSIVTPQGRREAFYQSDHVRLYGADFDDRLRAAGFEVDANRYALSLGGRTARYGLHQDETIYVCG
jgi:SAM-dependent methyltransferase